MPGYKKALRSLKEVLNREKNGRLKATEQLSEKVLNEVLRVRKKEEEDLEEMEVEEEEEEEEEED